MPRKKSVKFHQGFTLVEALVALVVLAFGLLAVAAMQIKALQSAHMGFERSLASLIAIDAEERAWAFLAEQQSCPDGSQITTGQGWQANWVKTPGSGFWDSSSISSTAAGCEYDISLSWTEGRYTEDGESVGTFSYTFRLPDIDG